MSVEFCWNYLWHIKMRCAANFKLIGFGCVHALWMLAERSYCSNRTHSQCTVVHTCVHSWMHVFLVFSLPCMCVCVRESLCACVNIRLLPFFINMLKMLLNPLELPQHKSSQAFLEIFPIFHLFLWEYFWCLPKKSNVPACMCTLFSLARSLSEPN